MISVLRRLLRSSLQKRFAATDSSLRKVGPTSNINLLAPEVVQNPYPYYAGLRSVGPVHFLTQHNFWLVLDYDDVLYALKHPQLFGSARATVRFDPVLNEADPPTHTRVRRGLAKHFSTRQIQLLEAQTRTIAAKLLPEDKTAELDLVNDFALPLTEQSIGSLIGLCPEEIEDLKQCLAPHRHSANGEIHQVMEGWLRSYVEHQQRGTSESVASCLLRGDGDRESVLTQDEVVSVMRLLWAAGTTTTNTLIGALALQLMQHPQVRAQLQSDVSLLPVFTEEAVRLEPSELLVWRVAREDVELGGVKIPRGEEVRLCTAAANRDPRHFTEPDNLSMERNPNKHISFGAGPHFCLGASLTRMEIRVALETLLMKWPNFRTTRPLSELSYDSSYTSRSLKHLFITGM